MDFLSANIFSCTTEQFRDPVPYIISCSKQSTHHSESVRLSSDTILCDLHPVHLIFSMNVSSTLRV